MSGVKERQEARRISVRGVVQGVGFRPFVYNLAQRYDIHGWVLNTSAGVEIEAEGASDRLTAFIWAIESETPLLARIESVAVQDVSANGYSGFEIRASEAQAGAYQLISPDVAACDACLQELSDPRDRRYRYPFINCTNCGPRFTIISDIPYDRPNTTMRSFAMCSDCQEEYEDPGNRRFHAQPNACPACGPHVWLEVASSDAPPLEQEAALAAAVRHLLAGRIVAPLPHQRHTQLMSKYSTRKSALRSSRLIRIVTITTITITYNRSVTIHSILPRIYHAESAAKLLIYIQPVSINLLTFITRKNPPNTLIKPIDISCVTAGILMAPSAPVKSTYNTMPDTARPIDNLFDYPVVLKNKTKVRHAFKASHSTVTAILPAVTTQKLPAITEQIMLDIVPQILSIALAVTVIITAANTIKKIHHALGTSERVKEQVIAAR